mgnify:CR=1 FL=1
MAVKSEFQKLIIVANRLPVSVTRDDNGKLAFTPSSGGLATAMSSLDIDPEKRLWIGWPGIASDELTASERTTVTKKLQNFGCYPVYLSADQVANFYSGYANDTIWPLFHYFQNHAQHVPEFWNAYKEVNSVYKQAVIKQATPESLIWIHDYHLMLLPELIRKNLPHSSIGFFLHIPFPSQEIFRLLPQRSEILQGLLGADLIGFHIYDYARHFLSATLRLLGVEHTRGTITLPDRSIKTDAFPLGIDYEKFSSSARRCNKSEVYQTLERIYRGQKVILSVDRLDYSKGIMKRLEAFEVLLEENPQLHKKLTLVVIAVPSRTEVETYKELRDQIELTVSRINGRYSTVDWTPISYQFKNLPFDELIALYTRADIALVTPLRDGMNLVAKEFVASKTSGQGVLILSEMAGAIDELHEAIKVNPNDISSLVRSIKKALRMPLKEQKTRLQSMRTRISRYTVQRWANDFIDELQATKNDQKRSSKQLINEKQLDKMATDFKTANSRKLFLDYDGTLKHFSKDFSGSKTAPSKSLTNLLGKLAALPNTEIYIISGRPHHTMDKWFSNLRINLAAEHGAWIKQNGKWVEADKPADTYKQKTLEIMKRYSDRTPGSKVEEKTAAIVWHYRNVVTELAYTRRNELRRELAAALAKSDIGIYNGNKIIEVKPKQINKGTVVSSALAKKPADFILCIGDDYTDEDMFAALPSRAYSIKVGHGETAAKFKVPSVDASLSLLQTFVRNQ